MVFNEVKNIILKQLEVNPSEITLDTNMLRDLNADSLDAVEILLALEEKYDIEFPDEVIEEFETVGDIVKYVEAKI